jgi:hypothetical protein
MRSANGNGTLNGSLNGQLTVRRLGEADLAQVLRLAELDSAPAPPAPLVGVESDGNLLAAASIRTGEVIADPFRRTAELRELLSAARAAPW